VLCATERREKIKNKSARPAHTTNTAPQQSLNHVRSRIRSRLTKRSTERCSSDDWVSLQCEETPSQHSERTTQQAVRIVAINVQPHSWHFVTEARPALCSQHDPWTNSKRQTQSKMEPQQASIAQRREHQKCASKTETNIHLK
jgi:hypothetical protein